MVSTNRCRSFAVRIKATRKGGWSAKIADRGPFGDAHPLDLLIDIDVDVDAVQLDIPPGRHGIGRDDLHRLVELFRRIGPPGSDAG